MAEKATLKFVFVGSDGTETRSPALDTVALRVTRSDTNESIDVTPDHFAAVSAQAGFHGLKQTLGDASTSGGKDATLDDRWEALADRLDVIKGGKWLAERESAGPRDSDVVLALARLKGYEQSEASTKWAGLSDEQKKALRANPAVSAAVAEIRLERAKAKAAKAEAAAPLEF